MEIPIVLHPVEPVDLSGGFGSANGGVLKSFSIQCQQGDRWCWIAVAASISTHFLSTSIWGRQCLLASSVLPALPRGNRPNCCQRHIEACKDGAVAACDKRGSTAKALTVTGNNRDDSKAALQLHEIALEFANELPIAARLGLAGKTKPDHVVVIFGLVNIDGRDGVVVGDPDGEERVEVPLVRFTRGWKGREWLASVLTKG